MTGRIVGHSGAGGVALNAGHTDPRYDAIVAWDPAGPSLAGVTLRIPTMIQVADYPLSTGPAVVGERSTFASKRVTRSGTPEAEERWLEQVWHPRHRPTARVLDFFPGL